MNEKEVILKPLTDDDVSIFKKWLNKDYIYKWFCPDGNVQKEAWLNEINHRHDEYSFMNHFMVYHQNKKIGFCLYFDCYYLQEYTQKNYGITPDINSVYEIGYLIGEEEYLNKGIGKIIIKKLEEKIIETGGKEIFADPGEGNVISIKTLLSNGFEKINDGDYRKKLK